jgi:hypothetical protein
MMHAQDKLSRLRGLARLLDTSLQIPGTRFQFGLDALLGLVPGIGDAVGALLSFYIVSEARRLGVSKRTLLRMSANVGIDTLVGAVPALGDLFDAGFKANIRNVALLEADLGRQRDTFAAGSSLDRAGMVLQ